MKPNTLAAVLVIYRKKLADSSTWQSLQAANVSLTLFVWDNSPEPQDVPESHHRIQYIHRPDNPGVSTAYNVAATLADMEGCEWLLLLDDDTSLPSSFFPTLIQWKGGSDWIAPLVYDETGLLSPFLTIRGRGRRLVRPFHGPVRIMNMVPINSGACIRLNSFRENGGFDEQLPLDFSDTDYFLRAAQRGQKGEVLELRLNHSLSSSSSFMDRSSALRRFHIYVRAAARFGRKHNHRLATALLIWARALKLTWKHRSLVFLAAAWNKG